MVADSGGPFDKLKGTKGREPEPGVDAEKKEVKMMSFAEARKKYKFGETFYNRTDGSSVRFIGVEGNTNKKRPRIDLNDEEKKVLEIGIYDSKSGKTNKEVISIKRANKFLEEYTISQKDWELLDEIRKDEEAKEARTAESLKILKEKLMQDAQGKSTADFEAENKVVDDNDSPDTKTGNPEDESATATVNNDINETQKSFSNELAKGLDEEFNDKYVFPRRAAEITLGRLDKHEKVNAENETEGDEKFKKETRKLWEDLVVHGRIGVDKNTGKLGLLNNADLDGKVSLGLMKLAGINIDKVQYVVPGGSISGKINIDTGEMDGLVVLEDGTAFIDHHGDFSDNTTSAAKHTLDALVSLGLLEKEEYLENLVEFVNKADNFQYPEKYFKNYFKDSWKTLIGLSKMLSWNELVEFFKYKDPKTDKFLSPENPMSDGLLRKFGFLKTDKKSGEKKEIGKSISHKERVMKSEEELTSMEKEGFIIESDRYGKICLNVDGRVVCGIDAAKAFGCDTILSWNTENNNFFISSLSGKKLEDNFVDGKNIRGTMWINPSDGNRSVSLLEVINKMTDGKFKPSKDVSVILGKDSSSASAKENAEENKDPSENDAEMDEREAEKQEELNEFINAGEKYYRQMEGMTVEGYSEEMKKNQMVISLEFFLRKIIQENSEFFKDEFEERAKEIAQNILTKHK